MALRQTGYYLGNANTVDPLLERPDIITAKIFDVLRLLLDLGVLNTHVHKCTALLLGFLELLLIVNIQNITKMN